jgi:hypothetical protein
MRFQALSKALMLGAALLLACTAFAASKQTMTIEHSVKVNGTELKAGDYKVEWEGTGPEVEVSFVQGKRVVAKAPAHLVDLSNASANNAAVTKANGGSVPSLSGVRFEGKKYALELSESSEGMQSGSSK